MKIWEEPPADHVQKANETIAAAPPRPKRRSSAIIPRCYCGCGKAALWPHDGKPLFHARLCAYEMMVARIRGIQETPEEA